MIPTKIKMLIATLISLLIILSLFPMNTVGASSTVISINPEEKTVNPGETFILDIICNPTEPIEGYEFDIIYDERYLQANSVEEGNIFNEYSTWFNPGTIDNSMGYINNVYSLITNSGNTSEQGTLAKISFTAFSTNITTSIQFTDTGISNDIGYIPISLINCTITIGDPTSNTNNTNDTSESTNSPPLLPPKPSGPQDCLINTTYTFSITTSDPENDEIYYAFWWDDNSISENLGPYSSNTQCNASHKWTTAGIYNITVRAKDTQGNESDWSPQLTIVVRNKSSNDSNQNPNMFYPTASFLFSPQEPIIKDTIQFTDTSIDKDGTISRWKWDFGDGQNSVKQHPTHHFDQPDEYKVTLTIWDNTNMSNSTTTQLVIEEYEKQSDQNKTPSLSIGIVIILLSIINFFRYKRKYYQ